MNNFFAIPTAASMSADIGSYTGSFFLPFLGPVLFLAGTFIAVAIVIGLKKTIVKGVKKLSRSR